MINGCRTTSCRYTSAVCLVPRRWDGQNFSQELIELELVARYNNPTRDNNHGAKTVAMLKATGLQGESFRGS